ncbi:39264_t:CDS:2, partial [Gigaspora margarita]
TSHPRSVMEVELVLYLSTTIAVESILEISVNAMAQRKIADEIEIDEAELKIKLNMEKINKLSDNSHVICKN